MQQMTDKKNIEDVTDSPDDWDDFWFNEDLGLSYSVDEETMRELMKPRNPVSNYVDDVLKGKNAICKRESPLSE
ncbi:hypothetical protein SSM1_079 [Synechococcus phage S-SM1]|jgi:hypothetical protein|uniref:Uncharacterized protein n=1 Tax=Synechococcus phage S-SM1 TaxID=444859 RepID=E3SI86_9CAUD|nr:hypothetical protein SSM1_079 [Synechococcus phage S-SM1]ADO97271.1 hypothetical protein SSM1_079 [Synechococcus phage S-SM1]